MSIHAMGRSVIGVVALLLLFGCTAGLPIGDVMTDPTRYRGREIALSGVVSDVVRLPFVDQSLYRLEDKTGAIWVLGIRQPPSRQERRTVRGSVQTGVTVRGRTFGVLLREGEKR